MHRRNLQEEDAWSFQGWRKDLKEGQMAHHPSLPLVYPLKLEKGSTRQKRSSPWSSFCKKMRLSLRCHSNAWYVLMKKKNCKQSFCDLGSQIGGAITYILWQSLHLLAFQQCLKTLRKQFAHSRLVVSTHQDLIFGFEYREPSELLHWQLLHF